MRRFALYGAVFGPLRVPGQGPRRGELGTVFGKK